MRWRHVDISTLLDDVWPTARANEVCVLYLSDIRSVEFSQQEHSPINVETHQEEELV